MKRNPDPPTSTVFTWKLIDPSPGTATNSNTALFTPGKTRVSLEAVHPNTVQNLLGRETPAPWGSSGYKNVAKVRSWEA